MLRTGLLVCLLVFGCAHPAKSKVVSIHDNQLFLDSEAQPQLFGAELQYFRLRGGPGPNIPREVVLSHWHRALQKMKEAKMNAIGFYIPWDFHEYKEGFFDFDGTVDEDKDGQPDYPSRDVITFLRLLKDYGFRAVMVRPGPYINAEWGFLGFGAIPLWFHEKYPDSHMRAPNGLRTKLYDYMSPDLLSHTQIWFSVLLNRVLKPYLGPGKMISFLQLDNETNYMWQSLYNHDYGPRAVLRFREFLSKTYSSLEAYNKRYHTEFKSWSQVTPPISFGISSQGDQDWYDFQDDTVYQYLAKVRTFWEDLGVSEPDVLFTLAESYNATENGLLPHYAHRNAKNKTGMMTVNLYPKTYETQQSPLLNNPFKADLDVKTAEVATDDYLGEVQSWVMGPEIQAGWWRGINVSPKARQQTYLTTVGHGMKALFVYYFNEGYNWQWDWQRNQVLPLYRELKSSQAFKGFSQKTLPNEFWSELQKLTDQKVILGIDSRGAINSSSTDGSVLFFDAPLDKDALPRNHFFDLKKIGEFLNTESEFLGKAVAVEDDICIYKDSDSHKPGLFQSVNSVEMNSTWAAGLLGYIMQLGYNPRVLLSVEALNKCQVVFVQDNYMLNSENMAKLTNYVKAGGRLVSFFGNSIGAKLGVLKEVSLLQPVIEPTLTYKTFEIKIPVRPLFSYASAKDCESILKVGDEVIATQCRADEGTLIQIGALLHLSYNTDAYFNSVSLDGKKEFLKTILGDNIKKPFVDFSGNAKKVVGFAKNIMADPKTLWITLKTGHSLAQSITVKLPYFEGGVRTRIEDPLNGNVQYIAGSVLKESGVKIELTPFDSKVIILRAD